mmetsp:Transcript_41776/g.99045  ORF Transcript_41776/g.99045 Transcript_41776/m.99045 type:complete len:525 (-) Transcript_41776:47-1621(-)|eukprot:CAMPEP_0180135530 /NCGR_PEP_ID=MMETSP0986-20121125/10901_1 /TAXON_ID=697907 /ORGANISM="non described non described, Strain CCMP2293" /LENGTH=524 /DNA_ID=CAMNT_0022076277 /DNA_START=43 /DNA_END=1617 /DNA_ORIENTATION=+
MADGAPPVVARQTSGFFGLGNRTVSTAPVIKEMTRAQWGYALFDAGVWGHSSVTLSTLAPLLFVHRLRSTVTAMAAITGLFAGFGGHEGSRLQMKQLAFRALHMTSLNETDSEEPEAGGSLDDPELGMEPGMPTTFDVSDASSTWVFMVALSTLAAAIICPILGAVADRYQARKLVVYVTATFSVLFTTLFALEADDTPWYWVLLTIGVAMMFTSVMHCFYNSLLMICADNEEMVKVACLQCVVGGIGAAILMLLLGMAHVSKEDLQRDYVVTAYLGAAIWFFLFSIPMWLWLHEPEMEAREEVETFDSELSHAWKATVKSMGNGEMMKFLLAMMLFNDANSTLHAVYLVYGAQIGLPVHQLLVGAVLQRFLSALSGLAWLGISQYADAKSCFMGCILLTVISIAMCAWMRTIIDFYIVVATMTVASAGSFIYGKVLMAYLTPKHKVSHNFGFMGMINRVAGFMGPLLFSTLSLIVDERAGFIGLIAMATCGMFVMVMVDFDKGFELANAEDQEEEEIIESKNI